MNWYPMIQEPVRTFLERLYPQKKFNYHPNTCLTNTESVDINKLAISINEVNTTSTPASMACNHSRTLELLHNTSEPGITFAKLEEIPHYNAANESQLCYRVSNSDNGECGQPLGLPANLKEKQLTTQPLNATGEPELPLVKNPGNLSVFTNPPEHHSALIFSMFPKVPPCLRFSDVNDKSDLLPWEFRKLLHWRPSLVTPVVVKQALARAHFRASNLTSVADDLDAVESSDWIYYFGKHLKPDAFLTIRDYQKVNHFPCSFHLGRKDRLWRNISAMQRRFGAENFNFAPLTFCMPTDLEKFKDFWHTEGAEHQWILKPPASARGLGVRVINKWSQIPKKRPLIVQRYLNNPYLINNSKFDLRIYVFIYSVHPLIVYVHEDGLVRFASHIYTNSPRFVGNRYVHLTNYSINRQNVDYISNASDETCTGHKWSLRAFWAYLRSHGVKPEPVWSSIKDVIAKTCIAIEPHLKNAVDTYCKSPYSVQELFGFDIFLDANLKPWVLEVNVSPSMHIDSPLDSKVKGTMIKDMLNLTGFNLPSPKDILNGNTKKSPMLPSGTPRLPPYQHLNINPDSDDVHLISQQTISPISSDTPPIKNEPLKWVKEVKKPTAPPHPWLLDRRVTMSKLSDDERKKHEYYVLRAYEASISKPGKTPRTSKHAEPSASNIVQPEIRLSLEPLPLSTPLGEPTIPTSISQGAGPDSLDLAAFMKLQEDHKHSMEKRKLERRQLLQRANMQALREGKDRWKVAKVHDVQPIGGKCWEEGDNFNLAVESESKPTPEPSSLEHFRWAVENIFDFITPFDLRCLVQMLDTKNRAGAFQPVFPADNTSTTASYLRFFDKPRYTNLLIFAYLDKYGESTEGITMLSRLCEREVHLKSRFFGDSLEESNVWKPPLPPLIPNTQKGYVENRIKRQVNFS
uniref:Tubulin polyglutamylase ttll4 n=1 Tax=Echinococcus granulosus TaxID=6210 RepID=A0A068WH15_ECHGR|nr:tubulin polyglutamylase ttll4 [Echinococcus granulosus]